MWDLPGPGLKPMSPALAGRFLTTAPPGKPPNRVFLICFVLGFFSQNMESERIKSKSGCRLYYVMNEVGAFFLSALSSLECGFHPEVASWLQNGCYPSSLCP